MRFITRLAVIFFAILLLIACIGVLWLRTSLPDIDGKVALAGLLQPTTIGRDQKGIVTIEASNWPDAYFALGFAHAQDRLGQMELLRRYGSGRLSELLGERGLAADKFSRLVGIRHLAEKQWEHASPDLQEALISYSKGVNAYLQQHKGALSPELILLDPLLKIESWQPVDSLIWGRIMALRLSSNQYEEAMNARLKKILPKEFFEVIAASPPRGASNNWVVSSKMSQSGKPLLANDPHLELSAPSPWYLAKLKVGQEWRMGATAPGMPFIVIGTNGKVAWGFTTTTGDNEDLFVEKNASANFYVTPYGLRPFSEWQEKIKIRKEERVFTFRRSRHGPIISDVIESGGDILAWSWAGFAEEDRSAEALLKMNKADNNTEFYEALRDFHTPQQNVVYADHVGEIGFVAAGRLPIRRNLLYNSLLPVPGDIEDYDWIGWIPFENLPQSKNLGEKNPDYFATANNNITPRDYPYFIAGKWESNYRINRIHELLKTKPLFSLNDMAEIQLDTLSPVAREFAPQLQDLAEGEIKELLTNWNFRMDRDKPQAAIFTLWLNHWAKTLATQAMGVEYDRWFFWQAEDLKRLAAQCHCPERMKIALNYALEELKSKGGNDPKNWKWGDLHSVHFTHPIWNGLPLLGSLLDVDMPASGDNFTLNRASPNPKDYRDIHGPTLRFLIDMAKPEDARFSVAGGQSGNILSPHYSDMLLDWNKGIYITIQDQPIHQLRLEPL